MNDRALLIAVRTACHPEVGTLCKATQAEELFKEALSRLKAVPHFAGLSLTTKNVIDSQVDDLARGNEYDVIFNGMTVLR